MTQEPTFIFSGHTWSPEEGKATFSYTIRHKNEEFTFHEVLTFPISGQTQNVPPQLLQRLLDNVSLILGISYYKLFCPKEIVLEGLSLNHEQAEFWNTVYTKGLGEFFYKNQIDFRGRIFFPLTEKTTDAISFPRQKRSLVGIGGGKDSIVTAELLKSHHKPFVSYLLNSSPLQEEVITLLGGEKLVVKRNLDPQIFELNKREDVFNGHIPISAIYAFVGIFLAVVYDFRYVIVSNEHSSSYGNVTYHDAEINHQWSKSLEFETMFQAYVTKFITPDVSYFSLLRPFTELSIIKKFIAYPQYFPHFSSCNRNFRIEKQGTTQKWCGECAKCAFAFVILAAFLPKEQVIKIFGENLLAKQALLETYKELLGVSAHKPFDCVGTPEEVKVAFYLAMQKNDYVTDVVMQFFQKEVLPKIVDIERLKKQVFESSKAQSMPEEFLKITQ